MSNSLAAVHPELIVEWSDRNLPLTPDSVTFGSNKKVWWKGACGHEWETSIKARSSGEKCPICSGARVIEGINDLSTLKPELASEWSEKNKIKPTEVSIGSHKKVIWKCKLEHEWIATVIKPVGIMLLPKDSATQEKRGVRMSKKRYEIVSYDIPLWLKPVLSVTETSIYTGISANKIYEMSESEDCPFVIWIGSRRVIKRKSFEEYLERQYSI